VTRARSVEHPGWRTHNRNAKGPWGPVHGSAVHHTASADGTSVVEFCYNGRSDLPGPLCHGVIRKSGVVHLVGNGRADHFGTIAQNAYDAVLNGSPTHPRPDAAEPIDGNARLYGWECVNRGDGSDPWPTAQVEAITRVQAAICEHHGWGANSVIGHKEGTRRKIDPAGLSMNALRVRVDQLLKAGPSGTTTPPTEDDMALTTDQAKQLAEIHAATTGIGSLTEKDTSGKPVKHGIGYYGAHTHRHGLMILASESAQTAAITKLAGLVGSGVDTAAVMAAVQQAIADAVVKVNVDVTGDTAP
jgi:hypothetical protein